MLLSAVMELHPTRPVVLPAFHGQRTHGWFMEWISGHDPALADHLHASSQLRPFTVSCIWGGKPVRSELHLTPETACYLRITSLSAPLSALLQASLLGQKPESIRVMDESFAVADVTTDPTIHPWAGTTTFEELLRQHPVFGGKEPERSVTMRFTSPTLFKSNGVMVPLPQPRLVFGSLAERWNGYAPLPVPPEVVRFAEECLVISRYRLQTALVQVGEGGQGRYPGFLGVCGYNATRRDSHWTGFIQLLAAFARFAGVGAKTSMGLGQCRVIDTTKSD